MDKDPLEQLGQITRELRKIVYSIKKPAFRLFDIDSTLLDTYGHQEREGFNVHYQTKSLALKKPNQVLREDHAMIPRVC